MSFLVHFLQNLKYQVFLEKNVRGLKGLFDVKKKIANHLTTCN